MIKAILMRTVHALLSMLALLIIVFGLVRLTGDPVNYLLPTNRTPAQEEQLREYLGLDKPLVVQFGQYLGNLVTGDLGNSFRMRMPVTDMIAQRLPATITMGAAAILLTVLPELLRDFAEYRMIVYALLIIFLMLLRPGGLFSINFKRRSSAA